MELKPISDLIDPGTRIAKSMTAISRYSTVFSGYLVFVIGGVLIERRLYDMSYNAKYDSCMYIIYKQVHYAINIQCKPISGAYNAQSLSSY